MERNKRGRYTFSCGDIIYTTPGGRRTTIAEFVTDDGYPLCGKQAEAKRLAEIAVERFNEVDCGQLASSDEAGQNPEKPALIPEGTTPLSLLIAIRDYAQDLLDDKGDLSPNERKLRAVRIVAYANAGYARVEEARQKMR